MATYPRGPKRRCTNDTHPQALNVVSQSTNSAKDAAEPPVWRLPLESAWCAYAHDWTTTNGRWNLQTTHAERAALSEMIDTCLTAASAGPRSEQLIEGVDPDRRPTIAEATSTPVPTPAPDPNCDPTYARACIPAYPPDVNCRYISAKRFRVIGTDVHDFDGDADADADSIACES